MPANRPRIPARAAVLALLLLLAAAIAAETLGAPRPPAPPAGPSLLASGAARVYHTTPSLAPPEAPDRQPDSPLLRAVLADIAAARRSVDIAVFDIDLPELGEALLAAHRRGARVRLALDSQNLEAPEMSALAGRLEEAGVPIRFDRREPFMHDKFIVLDGAVVWAGSWNMTANDTYRNHNNMVRLASRALAGAYAAEFAQLFAGRFGAAKRAVAAETPRARAYFSPGGGAQAELLRLLAGARRSVRFMAFSFTAAPVAKAMVERAGAGVAVSGVVERQNARGAGSVLGILRAGGVAALEDGGCFLLHHKVIVIDERIVVTGSYNFTASAEQSNDENMLVIEDAGVARAFLEEYARIAALAESPPRCQR